MSNFRIFTVLISLSLLTLTAKAQEPTYLYHLCPNTTTFSPNTTFHSNLNSLFSALSSNASTSNGFYNASSGQNPNQVNGLFLCRADVSATTCRNCVNYATTDVASRCPIEKEVVIWYEECLFRYSNKSIFSVLSDSPAFNMWNSQNATDPTRFDNIVGATLNKAATDAASATRRFAAERANISSIQSVYSLVQCTPDLSSSDCNRCLVQAIAILRSGKLGGRVLSRSCTVRFELYPFYNEAAVAVPAPPPPAVAPPPESVIINSSKGKGQRSWVTIIAIVIPVSVSIMFFIVGCCWLTKRGKKKYNIVQEDNAGADMTTIESLQYDLNTIEVATDKFAESNKLGEGGFGVVYKGTLPNGQEIAVKRLSLSSGQGIQEFKTEALLVAKLQHRNLVRLLGFCVEGEEKILVYEYVPNQSLDYFLFNPSRQGLLDWSRRYKIIGGVARGILYLHEDSRLRIIHRDLKASNVLLDSEMNAKISDFGMARIFGVDQTQGSTNRIVGTYGYMSPEYAMHGQFSVKSDIYSFGVLVLEILSGRKNSSFYETEGAGDLMSYAWKLWKDGRQLELLDPILGDSYARSEVIRCIQIGLLCVQEYPAERPTMATIALMLNSYSITLPLPNQPAFFLHSRTERVKELESDQSASLSQSMQYSINEASITELHPR